jgi:hypothetical protein
MRKDYLHGGYADKSDYSKFDQKQLRMGQKVEMEHTNDPKIAREIAGDHLEEIDDYYTRLGEMEKEAEHEPKGGVVHVSGYNRKTGHVHEHYRSRKMR